MTARLRAFFRSIGVFFDLTEPEPIRLNCGCSDLAHRYLCACGRTACEQHRIDHTCTEMTHA